jgi:predicted HicB family RNase H-like nuclease
MKDKLKYKDFIGSVHYSDEDEVFFGKIEGINDLITFEGKTVADLKNAFIESIEDYIAICSESKKPIHKSYKGSFNIRISSDLHSKAARSAQLQGISLNQFVRKAIEREAKTI